MRAGTHALAGARIVVTLSFALQGVGCGEPSVTPDVDATQGCPIPPGRSYGMRLKVAGPGIGYDLDGDTTIDNAFGELPAPLLDQVNRDVEASFVNGSTFFVLQFGDWSDPPSASDADISVNAMLGLDADASTQNNFDGTAQFYADSSSFDLNCNLAIALDRGTLGDRFMRTTAGSLAVPFLGWQTISYHDVILEGTFDADFTFIDFTIGGTLPVCALSAANASGTQPGSMLDVLVNNQAQTGVVPDIDADRDGVESMIGDGASVTECIDGDGTHIVGKTCACDPRMKDGYSLSVVGQGAFARIIGTR